MVTFVTTTCSVIPCEENSIIRSHDRLKNVQVSLSFKKLFGYRKICSVPVSVYISVFISHK